MYIITITILRIRINQTSQLNLIKRRRTNQISLIEDEPIKPPH